jgi:hypothetical protein
MEQNELIELYNKHQEYLKFDYNNPRRKCLDKYNRFGLLQIVKFAHEFEPIFIDIINRAGMNEVYERGTKIWYLKIDTIKRYSKILKDMLGDDVNNNDIYNELAVYDVWHERYYSEHYNKEDYSYTYLDVFRFYIEILKNLLKIIIQYNAQGPLYEIMINIKKIGNINNLNTYFIKYIELADREDLNVLNNALNLAYEYGNKYVFDFTEYPNIREYVTNLDKLLEYELNIPIHSYLYFYLTNEYTYNDRLGIKQLMMGVDIKKELPPYGLREVIGREYENRRHRRHGGAMKKKSNKRKSLKKVK